MRVLLIDEDAGVIKTLTYALTQWGHEVESRKNGASTLEYLKEVNGDIDIIICEVAQSEINGVRLASDIRENYYDINFVLIASDAMFMRTSIAIEQGACAYLEKPISLNQFETLLHNIEQLRISKRHMKVLEGELKEEEAINRAAIKDRLFARKLQNHIFPKDFSWLPRSRAYLRNLPMDAVGGDFIDVRPYGENRALIMVADVSGHGTAAAFGGVALKSWFTSLELELRPTEVLERADEMITQIFPEEFVATAVCCLYDEKTRELEYSIAGAPAPFVISYSGNVNILEGTGAALGLRCQTERTSTITTLKQDDTAFIFTDGLTQTTSNFLPHLSTDSENNQLSQTNINILLRNLPLFVCHIVDTAIQSEPLRAYSDDISILAFGPAAPAKVSQSNKTLKGKKILLFDDDPIMFSLNKHIFEREEAIFTGITSAVNCVEDISRVQPDLVIMDIMMPELNGMEALKEIRKKSPDLPVIICSGMAQDQVARIGIDLNIASFVEKPIKAKEYIKAALNAANYHPGQDNIEFDELDHGWMDFVITSSSSTIDLLGRYLSSLSNQPVPSSILQDVVYCTRELVGNAIEWGNLNNPKFKVRVSTIFLDDRVMIKISDEGSGFNPKELFEEKNFMDLQEQREVEGKRLGGFGVTIVKEKMDSISFSNKGNSVLMVKKFDKSGT